MYHASSQSNADSTPVREIVMSPTGKALDVVDRICRQFSINPLRSQLEACTFVVDAGNMVDVAVVGRFKAGKSSFLNTLIGRNVMPVGVLPLTAVVTRARYGSEDKAVVQYHDGHMCAVALDEVAEFVTEPRNPCNVKHVAIVDVEVTGLQQYCGVRFVDTPGLDSVYAHNTRTSMEWLPRVGGALLAVSIDQPLSEYDIELLKELGKHTPETAILLTKADLVSPGELADVEAFVREQVAKGAAVPVRVFPFSARPGYETLQDAVQVYLREQVAARHEEKAREIILYKLHTLVGECRQYLGMALSAAGAAQEARAELQRQLQKERDILSTVRNELWLLCNDLKTRVGDASVEVFLKHRGQLTTRLSNELRTTMRQWRGNLAKTTEAFQGWAQETVRSTLVPLSNEEGSRLVAQQLAAAEGSFSRFVRAFQDRLAGGVQKSLGINFIGATFEATVRQPLRPNVNIGRVFDTPFDLLWFIIPMWLFRPLVRRHFLNRLPWEVEKNLHRLAGQWSDAITGTVDDMATQAQDFIQEELDTIEALVAKAQDQQPAIAEAIDLLDKCEVALG